MSTTVNKPVTKVHTTNLRVGDTIGVKRFDKGVRVKGYDRGTITAINDTHDGIGAGVDITVTTHEGTSTMKYRHGMVPVFAVAALGD